MEDAPPPVEDDLNLNTPCGRFRANLVALSQNFWFTNFVTLLIILNTVTMMMEYHDMPESLVHFLEMTNYIFTALFTGEMVSRSTLMLILFQRPP